MTDTKTFVIPEGGGYGGLDPNLLFGMNGGMGGGMWNNPIWALVFLAFLGNNFGGWGGGNNSQLSQIQDTLNTNQGNTLLMDAIKGNGSALQNLATSLNCDLNAVQSAIDATRNAIQFGNQNLSSQMAQCCCDNKMMSMQQGYESRINNIEQSNMITKGFGDVAYATQTQTTALAANQDANTRAILAKIDAVQDEAKNNKIAELTSQLATVNARAERQAELAPIWQALKDIQCKQPETVTVPYSPITPVPSCVAWNAALYGGYGYPYAQQGNVFS